MNPFNHKIPRATRHLVLMLLASLLLVSCGGKNNNTSSALATATATMQAGTIAVGSAEVGTAVAVSSDGTGQTVLTVQNANSKLVDAQLGQVMVFEANSGMPLGFAGIVQSVQNTSVGGVPTTTATYTPAAIANVFQNLNLNMSNVATNPQLIAGVALQNGVRAYTRTEPQVADGLLGRIQNGLIELNVLANNTATTIGVDFSGNGGVKASFWKVNNQWIGTDPCPPTSPTLCTPVPKVDIAFTGKVELINPDFSRANIVIENSKLVTHNLQLKGTLKRDIKATVTGNLGVNASELAGLFSGATSSFYSGSGYNEYSFDYKGGKIKVHGVEKDPSKIILGAFLVNAATPITIGNGQTAAALKTIPIGMVVTFFMTADMQVEATASLGYQWRDMDINAGMGVSYDDSLGLPISLLTGNAKLPVPFWDSTAHLDQTEGASYDVTGSTTAILTAGIDGGIVVTGIEIAQATVEGGIRGNLSGQFSKPVGGLFGGCYSSATVTTGVRALLDVAAEVDLKTDFKSKWLKWFNTSVTTGYVYQFPMYPAAGVDWLGETTIWSVGNDTCHNPQFSATAGTALYSYSFDATATGYQPMVTSYAWDFGDGTTSTGITATHAYSTSGTYTAILTVLFSDGIQRAISKPITVTAIPALNPAFTVNFTGLQASFNAGTSTPSADITSYAWSFGDGATASGITTTHTYVASNTPRSVTLTVTDTYGRTASTSQNVSATCPSGQVLQNGQCVTPPPPTPTTSTLNDTGITSAQCYQAGSDILVACDSAGALALNNAQDGMVGRDANATTNSATDGKLGFSFASIPAAGVDPGGCVQDNVTGLMWEVKTADGGLRDRNKTYTNYDSTLSAQKLTFDSTTGITSNPTQTEIDALTNSVGFKNSVNALGMCGFSDWRLPTADELQSIVDYGVAYPGPTIDSTWFPNTPGGTVGFSAFWSASPSVGFSLSAWDVDFYDGGVHEGRGIYFRGSSFRVRLVRAGQPPVLPRYTVSADGQEVTDNQTKLIWRRCAEGMNWDGATCAGVAGTFTIEPALRQAAAQATRTGLAWRLPDVKELSSIIDRSRRNPAIDPAAFPATPSTWFWSASPSRGSIFAWFVNFGNGLTLGGDFRFSGVNVRLVRAAP